MRPLSHKTYRGYIDNHIKPSIGKSRSTIVLSGLAETLQKAAERRQGGAGRVQEPAQRAECQDSAQHQPDDFLSREFCHRPKADCDKSDGWLRPAQAGAPGDETPSRRVTGIFPPRSQRERRVRDVLHRTGHRPLPGCLLGLKWEDIDLDQARSRCAQQQAAPLRILFYDVIHTFATTALQK